MVELERGQNTSFKFYFYPIIIVLSWTYKLFDYGYLKAWDTLLSILRLWPLVLGRVLQTVIVMTMNG